MSIVSLLIAVIGLATVLSKRSLLGILLGCQFMFLSLAMMLVESGLLVEKQQEGYAVGIMIVICAVVQLVAGFAVTMRTLLLGKKGGSDELRRLKY